MKKCEHAYYIGAIIFLLIVFVVGLVGMKWYVDKQRDHAIKWSDTKDKIAKDDVKYDYDAQMAHINDIYERIDELEALTAKLQKKQKQTEKEVAEFKTHVDIILRAIYDKFYQEVWDIERNLSKKIQYEAGRIDKLYEALLFRTFVDFRNFVGVI